MVVLFHFQQALEEQGEDSDEGLLEYEAYPTSSFVEERLNLLAARAHLLQLPQPSLFHFFFLQGVLEKLFATLQLLKDYYL